MNQRQYSLRPRTPRQMEDEYVKNSKTYSTAVHVIDEANNLLYVDRTRKVHFLQKNTETTLKASDNIFEL